MTNREAIEILKSRLMLAKYIDSEYVDSVDIDAIDMAIAALEKQEEKTNYGRPSEWRQVSKQTVICLVCGKAVNGKLAREFRYCPFCGTRIKDAQ